MKKKIVASLVATLAVGATCAFAANPFVDVPADSWAYKSVSQLAQQGVIQGVDGSYFQGERNITRYEAAEMVAKAMAHMDKADAEQRAMINKLADEFSDELNNLGVRVSNLENKVGNVKTTGDFRLRYQHQSDGYTKDADNKTTSDKFDMRARIRFNANVNDTTKVTVGYTTGNINFDSGKSVTGTNDTNYVDLANVSANIGNHFNVLAGRYNYQIGNGLGLQHSDTFDGIQGKYMGNNWGLTVGYGEFKEGADYAPQHAYVNGVKYALFTHSLEGVKTTYASIDGTFKNVSAGVYYNNFGNIHASEGYTNNNVSGYLANNLKDLWGVYASVNMGKDWNIISDYQKVNKDTEISDIDENGALWGTQLKYRNASFAKKGSWDAWLEYISADKNVLYGSTNSWRSNNLLDNVKSWGVGVDYTVAKNVMFSAMQSFASSVKDSSYGVQDPDEQTRAQFMFIF